MVVAALEPEVAAGPILVAAGLLAVAGVSKFRAPAGAGGLLAALGLPSSPGVVRALGGVELAVAAAAFAVPGRAVAVAVLALYVVFGAVSVVVLARGLPVASCGCLGKRPAPPSAVHVLLNVACAGAAALALAVPPPRLDALLPALPLGGAPFVLAVAVATWLAVAVLAHLPQALGAFRPGRG